MLGLLASDGFTEKHICKNGSASYYSIIELAENQIIKDICNKYNKEIHYRKRIIANKEREFWSVRFNNNEMKKYGMYLIVGRPNIKELYDSFTKKDQIEFIRGIFDGDGSICFYPDGYYKSGKVIYRKVVGFSVNSSQPDMRKILLDFADEYDLVISEFFDKRNNGSWYISFNGQKSLECIYHLFFNEDHDIKNIRKYNKFREFYEICCTKEESNV